MTKAHEPTFKLESSPVVRTVAIMIAIVLAPAVTPYVPPKVYAIFQSWAFRFAYLFALAFFLLGTGNIGNAVVLAALLVGLLALLDFLAKKYGPASQ